MEALLSSPDLSNTPTGKSMAESYAAICRELNNALKECESMFRMGAYSEAKRLNLRNHPSLVERWKILNFAKRQKWIELCRLYNWQVPPEFDQETINKLMRKNDADKEFTLEDLQNQWRRIIRDGSVLEKLILARRIYAIAPDKAGYANLINMERPWIKKLKNEADAAMEENRPEDLAEIYKELTSQELKTKVSAEELKKYHPILNEFKKKKLSEQKKEALDLIASAYSAMLLPELEKALAEWAELEKNPQFFITRDEELQISDARNFFREQQAKINEEENFESLQNQLEMMLDDESTGDPVEIARVYHQLQMFDRPIRIVLEERFNDYQARKELENKRNHTRKCFYWGCSAAVIFALIFSGIYFVQMELEVRRDSSKIREMLSLRHIEAALAYCNKIAKERPRAAKRAAIVALKKEAENMLEESIAAEEIFNKTCQNLENSYLNENNILDPATLELFDILEEKAKLIPEEKAAAKENLRLRYEDIKSQLFQKNELEFLKDVNAIVKKWDELFNNLENSAENDAMNRRDKLQLESEKILNHYRQKVENSVFVQSQNNFTNLYRQANDKITQLRQLKADTRTLYYPDSLDSFNYALGKIPTLSQKMSDKFSLAMDQFPREKSISSIRQDDKSRLEAAPYNLINPFFRDVKTAGFPRFYHAVKTPEFSKEIEHLRDTVLRKEYNVHEFKILSKSDGKIYHFYTDDPKNDLRVEINWMKTRIKAVNIRFILSENKAKGNTVFKVSRLKNGLSLTRPGNQQFDALPDKFKLSGIEADGGKSLINRAAHYLSLQENLATLSQCNSYTDVMHALVSVVENKNITNVYAKAHLLRYLLRLLPLKEYSTHFRELEPLTALVNTTLATELDTKIKKDRWFDPSITFKLKDALTFQNQLDILNIRKIAGTIYMNEALLDFATSHFPVASGVIFADNNGKWRLHAFANGIGIMNLEEVFVHHQYGENKNKLFSTALNPSDFNMKAEKNTIDANVRKYIYNGQLVFASTNLDSYGGKLKNIIKEIKELKWQIPDDPSKVVWPESWPLNRRDLKQDKK